MFYVSNREYRPKIKSVIIGNSVTSIGGYAFYKCTGLTSITIPDSVTSIGDEAFSFTAWYDAQPDGDVYIGRVYYRYKGTMPDETSIVIKEGTKAIADSAFEDYTRLKSITIPDSVTNIGDKAFYGCTGLTGIITIPDSVTSIGYGTFRSCYGLTSITIPNSVTRIGNYAFEGCAGLTSITIPDSVTSIGVSAFEECYRLTSVYITDLAAWCNISFGSYYANPLSEAEKLYINGVLATDITIPDSVTSIGKYAFYGCDSLTSVTIPDSVTSIGDRAFYGCSGLTSIYITDLAAWCNIPFGSHYANPLYSAEKLYINGELVTDITIPDSVTSIGESAFCDCDSLTSVTIPDSVTSIGKSAFAWSTGLKSVTIGAGVTSIGNYAFSRCSGLTKINWNAENVSDFKSDNDVFYNAGTAGDGVDLIFGDNVKNIPAYVVYASDSKYRPKIKSVTIGAGVTSISDYAFYDCIYLIKINWNAENVKDFSYRNSVFYNAGTAGDGIDVVFGDNVKYIPAYAFHVSDSEYRPPIASVTIGAGVTKISDYAFYDCIYLININWNAENAGNFSYKNEAFYKAGIAGDGIDVVFGDNVKRIPSNAFYIDRSSFVGDFTNNPINPIISSVTIGKSVTSIGSDVFRDCADLTVINWNHNSQQRHKYRQLCVL